MFDRRRLLSEHVTWLDFSTQRVVIAYVNISFKFINLRPVQTSAVPLKHPPELVWQRSLHFYILVVYLAALSIAQTIRRHMVGRLANNELEKCGRKRP
jgi:hypothetical protein